MTQVAIDLNVRVRGGQTLVGLGDVEGEAYEGNPIWVYEPESGLCGEAVISEIDPIRELVYLDVPWDQLRVLPPLTGEEIASIWEQADALYEKLQELSD